MRHGNTKYENFSQLTPYARFIKNLGIWTTIFIYFYTWICVTVLATVFHQKYNPVSKTAKIQTVFSNKYGNIILALEILWYYRVMS